MADEENGLPISQCIVQSQEQKPHAHVVKAPLLEEPARPVKALDPPLGAVSEGSPHVVLGDQYKGH